MAQTLLIVGVRTLGRQIALHFGRQGWNVCGASRTHDDVEALAREVESAGGHGLGAVADLGDPASLGALVGRVQERFGRIDLCVAAQTSGAHFGSVPLLHVSETDFAQGLSGYPTATLRLLQAVAPAQIAQGGGTFLQMGTSSGLRARAGFSALAAAQHALRALISVAAKELSAQNVHVADLAIEGEIESEKSASYAARVGVSRTIPPSEIAKACEYLHGQDARAWTYEMSLRPAAAEDR